MNNMKDVCKIGAVLTSSISTRLFSCKEKKKKVGVRKTRKMVRPVKTCSSWTVLTLLCDSYWRNSVGSSKYLCLVNFYKFSETK